MHLSSNTYANQKSPMETDVSSQIILRRVLKTNRSRWRPAICGQLRRDGHLACEIFTAG
jgi:hypothetical protein